MTKVNHVIISLAWVCFWVDGKIIECALLGLHTPGTDFCMSHDSTRETGSARYIYTNLGIYLSVRLPTYLSINKGIYYQGLVYIVPRAASAVPGRPCGYLCHWRLQFSGQTGREAHKQARVPQGWTETCIHSYCLCPCWQGHPAEAGVFCHETEQAHLQKN